MPAPGLKRLVGRGRGRGREVGQPVDGLRPDRLLFTGLLPGCCRTAVWARRCGTTTGLSPLLMTAIALPLYIGPLQGMMRLGLMFEHGNSVGGGVRPVRAGHRHQPGSRSSGSMILFGWRRVLAWLGLITVATLVLAYAAEGPLYFAHEEASHTHAFDEWTSPFPADRGRLAARPRAMLQKVGILEAARSRAGVSAAGWAGRYKSSIGNRRLETWLTKPPPPRIGRYRCGTATCRVRFWA